MKTITEVTPDTLQQLCKFVNQRPGFDFANYGSMKYYRQDYNESLKDRNSFFDLLNLAHARFGDKIQNVLTDYLTQSNDRLTLVSGKLQYITGQYFPTEYRNAACRVLASVIWNDYRDEKREDGTHVYKDGNEIRKAIRSNYNIRTRNTKLFFN